MEKELQKWAQDLRINPSNGSKDTTAWDRISKNIKTKRQRRNSFWDTKILLIFTVLLTAVFAYIIIASILGKGLGLWVLE